MTSVLVVVVSLIKCNKCLFIQGLCAAAPYQSQNLNVGSRRRRQRKTVIIPVINQMQNGTYSSASRGGWYPYPWQLSWYDPHTNVDEMTIMVWEEQQHPQPEPDVLACRLQNLSGRVIISSAEFTTGGFFVFFSR